MIFHLGSDTWWHLTTQTYPDQFMWGACFLRDRSAVFVSIDRVWSTSCHFVAFCRPDSGAPRSNRTDKYCQHNRMHFCSSISKVVRAGAPSGGADNMDARHDEDSRAAIRLLRRLWVLTKGIQDVETLRLSQHQLRHKTGPQASWHL